VSFEQPQSAICSGRLTFQHMTLQALLSSE
jgi:hypothetical protein